MTPTTAPLMLTVPKAPDTITAMRDEMRAAQKILRATAAMTPRQVVNLLFRLMQDANVQIQNLAEEANEP